MHSDKEHNLNNLLLHRFQNGEEKALEGESGFARISELPDISTGTVKSRLFHAWEKLKQIITNQQGNPL